MIKFIMKCSEVKVVFLTMSLVFYFLDLRHIIVMAKPLTEEDNIYYGENNKRAEAMPCVPTPQLFHFKDLETEKYHSSCYKIKPHMAVLHRCDMSRGYCPYNATNIPDYCVEDPSAVVNVTLWFKITNPGSETSCTSTKELVFHPVVVANHTACQCRRL